MTITMNKEPKPQPEIELFDDDEAASYSDIELNDGLITREIEEAARLVPFSKGIMAVTGMPGQGKDLLGTVLSYKIKRYFKARHAVRDERPRSLYGIYAPFNEGTLLQAMARLESIAKGEVSKEAKTKAELDKLNGQIAKWHSKEGEVMMQMAVAHLCEFWRYMHNRRPHNPMGVAIGGWLKTWRHLDCLIIGTTQQLHELDAISCQPYITHEVRCSWSTTRPNTTECKVYKVRYISTRGIYEMGSRKPTTIWVDGGKQRPELGIFLVPEAIKPVKLSTLENMILEALHDKKYVPLYDLAKLLEEDLHEVEGAVWRLIGKNIIQAKRYFDLYNSKSAVAIKTSSHFKM